MCPRGGLAAGWQGSAGWGRAGGAGWAGEVGAVDFVYNEDTWVAALLCPFTKLEKTAVSHFVAQCAVWLGKRPYALHKIFVGVGGMELD